MTRLTALALAALLAVPAPALAGPVTHGPLAIDGAWSRPGIPNRPAAAYLQIENTGEAADALVGASSPAFGRIELHTVSMQDGVMQMAQVERIDIPAGETVTLAPRGLHLMLFDGEAQAEGAAFPLTLTFETAGSVEISVPVTRDGPAMDHGSMDHSGHGN